MDNKNKYYYEIEVTYAEVLPVGENGAPIEVEKTETVKVRYLSRTNRHHTKLALQFIKFDNIKEAALDTDVAELFVEHAIDADDKLKKAIKNDLFACINIFHNAKVMEDMDSFLLKLNFVLGSAKGESEMQTKS